MKEAYVYLGHSIELNLTRHQQFFGCTYFIDAQYCFQGSEHLLDLDAARVDALAGAHQSIALLNAMGPIGAATRAIPRPK